MADDMKSLFKKEIGKKGDANKLGLVLTDLAPGYAAVEMIPEEDDTNLFGMVHGGAIFSLMDEAFQASCNSHGTIAVALSVNIIYHAPAGAGEKLLAVSKEIHRTKKTATYEIKVTNAEEMLVASCQALAYRKKDQLPFLND